MSTKVKGNAIICFYSWPAPGRFLYIFKTNFQHYRWPILVLVTVSCHQATRHNPNQCWPISMAPYDVTRPKWIKVFRKFVNIDFSYTRFIVDMVIYWLILKMILKRVRHKGVSAQVLSNEIPWSVEYGIKTISSQLYAYIWYKVDIVNKIAKYEQRMFHVSSSISRVGFWCTLSRKWRFSVGGVGLISC